MYPWDAGGPQNRRFNILENNTVTGIKSPGTPEKKNRGVGVKHPHWF